MFDKGDTVQFGYGTWLVIDRGLRDVVYKTYWNSDGRGDNSRDIEWFVFVGCNEYGMPFWGSPIVIDVVHRRWEGYTITDPEDY